MDYSRDLRPAEWDSGIRLHSSNPEPLMSALGHSRPSHFVPVLNNIRYASDSDHSRYESELTLWAISRHSLVLSALACDERANLARVGKNHVRAVARHSRAD